MNEPKIIENTNTEKSLKSPLCVLRASVVNSYFTALTAFSAASLNVLAL